MNHLNTELYQEIQKYLILRPFQRIQAMEKNWVDEYPQQFLSYYSPSITTIFYMYPMYYWKITDHDLVSTGETLIDVLTRPDN
jgi:hypothetical protein